MMKHFFILFCLSAGITCFANAQVVSIPDANFKAYLLGNFAINTNGDGDIQVSEATAFNGIINCYTKNIADFTGIEAFVNLRELHCGDNPLTRLDLSNNAALEIVSCYSDQLTSLDVSHNIALKELYCWGNQLTSIDVRVNTALTKLACNENQLVRLDVSRNTTLTMLACYSNKLISLDVSRNTALTSLYCYDNLLTSLNIKNGNNAAMNDVQLQQNPNLTCIQVDDTAQANAQTAASYWQKDATAGYGENCLLSISATEQPAVRIYPNPVRSALHISCKANTAVPAVLTLTNSSGSILLRRLLDHDAPTIYLDTYPAGIYFLTLITNEGIVAKSVLKE